MKKFIILFDWIAHTEIYLVKAENKKKALEKFAIEELAVERQSSSEWVVKDFGNTKYNMTYHSFEDFIQGEYSNKPSFRLEIQEVNFDSETDVQLIFNSKEKNIS